MTVVEPITETWVSAVCRFLHAQLDAEVTPEMWRAVFEPPWLVEAPNRGFMLLDGGELVGVLGALYSHRLIRGTREQFCNLFGWSVLPTHRRHSLKLLYAALSAEGYHFTDLSPLPALLPLLQRLGFQILDTTTTIVPNLPLTAGSRCRIHTGDRGGEILNGESARIFRDHRDAPAVRQLVVERAEGICHLVYRVHRRKNVRCATVLYVSDPTLFARGMRAVGAHFLLRHGALLTLLESRLLPEQPKLSARRQPNQPKAFKAASLGEAEVDYLYSELVLLPFY